MGDWELYVRDYVICIDPNPQYPIPNPQSPMNKIKN